jgi:hypothetical protein
MSLSSKLKIESIGMFVSLVFYAAVGVIFFILLPLTSYMPTLAILGIFSLITAYGLFRKRNWTIWIIVILLFTGTAFSVSMISYALWRDPFMLLGTIAYLILTWVFTAYTASKRSTLES